MARRGRAQWILTIGLSTSTFVIGFLLATASRDDGVASNLDTAAVAVDDPASASCDCEVRFGDRIRELADEVSRISELLKPQTRESAGHAAPLSADSHVASQVRDEISQRLSLQARREDLVVAARQLQKRVETARWTPEIRAAVVEAVADYLGELRTVMYGEFSVPRVPASGTADYSEWLKSQSEVRKRAVLRLGQIIPRESSAEALLGVLTPEPYWGLVEGH